MVMRISNKTKFMSLLLLVVLNIILRFQGANHEIGLDSFLIHIMVNSLSEFGYAKWFLHPLSIVGLYPASYTSSLHFLVSGISQSTGMEMESTIFLYCTFIGLLSMLTAYLMAGEIIDNDLFKLLVAFGFSTSPAVLGYTTWTIPTRALFVVMAPLLVYLLFKSRKSIRYIPITVLFGLFLFTTHHLFYFLIPALVVIIIINSFLKIEDYLKNTVFGKFTPFIPIIGFILMFSIPFFTGHFIERSRYSPIYFSYFRYIGILIVFSISGLFYLIFKSNKRFEEWFLLLTLILLTTFIYEQTYMKWFLPIFVIPLAGIGLINILKASEKRKYILPAFTIFLLLTITFSGFYQFLHTYETYGYNERYIEESTYKTGRWMKDNIDGSAISNDMIFGNRIFSASETTHLLTPSTTNNNIYGFISINISNFKRYPITSEDFWFSGYEGPDPGEDVWKSVHMLWEYPQDYNITHVVENKKTNGDVVWHHSSHPVELLKIVYGEKYCIYDNGKVRIWDLQNV